ncbi:MAG: crossover junction endodeoxyribonuclease RuvC [Myxococcales bacterium]|nr:crossover junction endodeoxyribonuclease RuvC [Myxococcales bacterium]|tara:strand:+ start:474 stop:971 length:498 start_codon:yes stop_codon:yes gene_type:complete
MRIFGVDPGSNHTGWGVLEVNGSKFTYVAAGTISPKGDLNQRLRGIADELDVHLQTYKPEAFALEKVFYAKNVNSALVLGHARGVALLSAARQEIPVFEYSATQIKQAATGHGRASKEQVRQMLEMIVGAPAKQPLDASDALAVALCHGQSRHQQNWSDKLKKAL